MVCIITKFRDSSFSQLEIKVGEGSFASSFRTQKQVPKILPRRGLKNKLRT